MGGTCNAKFGARESPGRLGGAQQARDGLLEGDGADQIRKIHDAQRILLPIGTANGWMKRADDQALFGVEPPMRRLLEPGGLAAIHRLLLEQLEAR